MPAEPATAAAAVVVAFDDEREGRELAQRRAVFIARRSREARAAAAARPATDRRGDVANGDEARRVRAWWASVAVPRARTR